MSNFGMLFKALGPRSHQGAAPCEVEHGISHVTPRARPEIMPIVLDVATQPDDMEDFRVARDRYQAAVVAANVAHLKPFVEIQEVPGL